MTNEKQPANVRCPGCNGWGSRSAMSGAHVAYDAVCSDCNGTGRVTQSDADRINKRHDDWMKRQRR